MASAADFEKIILTIIPTSTTDVPERLITTARALFVQSKQKITTLKPVEEPARTYLCCHVACERLRARLDLPPIKPRPPLPKRAYEKLYQYFDQTLTDAPARGRLRGSSSLTANAKSKVPKNVQAAIHTLCERLDTPKAEQYVLTGIEYVLSKSKEEQEDQELAAWIILAYITTIKRLDARKRTGADHIKLVKQTIKGLGSFGNGIGQTRAMAFLDKHNQLAQKWKWVEAIPIGGGTGGTIKDTRKRKRQMGESGIGRMIQDRVDFLSEKRTAHFEAWREKIVAQLEAVAAAGKTSGQEALQQHRTVLEAN